MRNKILGTIGIVWGGAMLISFFARGAQVGTGAYASGAYAGLAFGVVMIIVGITYVRK